MSKRLTKQRTLEALYSEQLGYVPRVLDPALEKAVVELLAACRALHVLDNELADDGRINIDIPFVGDYGLLNIVLDMLGMPPDTGLDDDDKTYVRDGWHDLFREVVEERNNIPVFLEIVRGKKPFPLGDMHEINAMCDKLCEPSSHENDKTRPNNGPAAG